MKIVIPVIEDKNTESEVFDIFENSKNLAFIDLQEDKYFIDIKEENFENLSNDEIVNKLVEENVEIVIANQIEENICKIFSENKIMVVYEAKGKVENIVGAFSAMLANQNHSCNSCSGSCEHDDEHSCCSSEEHGCGGCH